MENKNDIIDYLLKTLIPTDLSQSEESVIHGEIFKKCHIATPSDLFRYRSCSEYSFDALEKDQFILMKPTLFNDPYDSLIYVDKSAIINGLKKDEKENEQSLIILDKLKTDEQFRQSQIELLGEKFVNYFSNATPFKDQDDYSFHKELSSKFFSKFIDNLTTLSLASLKQSSYVGCLSGKIDSILMWSHYAQNHEGFALCYDFKSRYAIDVGSHKYIGSEFIDKKLFPVRYSKERFDATYYVEHNFIYNFYTMHGIPFDHPFFDKLFYYKILLFKSTEWQYEHDWRIIKQSNLDCDDKKPDISIIENIRPKSIYLGTNINPINKKRLLSIAKQKQIKVYEMKLENFSKEYSLSYSLIDI